MEKKFIRLNVEKRSPHAPFDILGSDGEIFEVFKTYEVPVTRIPGIPCLQKDKIMYLVRSAGTGEIFLVSSLESEIYKEPDDE